jgi:hypothetical protein
MSDRHSRSALTSHYRGGDTASSHSTMPDVSRVLAIFLMAWTAAGEWTLGITSFDNPKRLTIEAEPGTALRLTSGTRRIVLYSGSTAGLLATGDEIDVFAQRVTSTAHNVKITGFDGGPAKFTLRDGIHARGSYVGVLEVTAWGGVLRPICRVANGIAPPAGRPRHRGFDFCDQAHCGVSTQPGRR